MTIDPAAWARFAHLCEHARTAADAEFQPSREAEQ